MNSSLTLIHLQDIMDAAGVALVLIGPGSVEQVCRQRLYLLNCIIYELCNSYANIYEDIISF